MGFIGGGSSRHSSASSTSSGWCWIELVRMDDGPGSDGATDVGAGDSGSSFCLSYEEVTFFVISLCNFF